MAQAYYKHDPTIARGPKLRNTEQTQAYRADSRQASFLVILKIWGLQQAPECQVDLEQNWFSEATNSNVYAFWNFQVLDSRQN